jgi:hypothetical protein
MRMKIGIERSLSRFCWLGELDDWRLEFREWVDVRMAILESDELGRRFHILITFGRGKSYWSFPTGG